LVYRRDAHADFDENIDYWDNIAEIGKYQTQPPSERENF
jgi:hypothetical protein